MHLFTHNNYFDLIGRSINKIKGSYNALLDRGNRPRRLKLNIYNERFSNNMMYIHVCVW